MDRAACRLGGAMPGSEAYGLDCKRNYIQNLHIKQVIVRKLCMLEVYDFYQCLDYFFYVTCANLITVVRA